MDTSGENPFFVDSLLLEQDNGDAHVSKKKYFQKLLAYIYIPIYMYIWL